MNPYDFNVRSEYLRELFTPDQFSKLLLRVVTRATEMHNTVPFDTIAFTGHSGSLVVPAVSFITGYRMTLVRKPGVSSHSDRRVEGFVKEGAKYIIIDDMVCSGNTLKNIIESIAAEKQNMQMAGLIVYRDCRDSCLEGIHAPVKEMLPVGFPILSAMEDWP